MASIIKTTFQLKRGKAATWQRLNPVLAIGEPGYETDTGALKIGNGQDAWLDLPYLSTGEAGEILASLQKDVIDIQKQLGEVDENAVPITDRLSQIEKDYLTSADKLNIETAIQEAQEAAVNEATERILGENVDADFDTLQEIAKWIESDTTESAALIVRISDVEKKVAALEAGGTTTTATIEYEIFSRPEGSMVDYRDKEIRLFCAEDTNWTLQSSGEGADPNSYYVGFKAYAPDNSVVSFKEDLGEIITDNTLYYFEDNDFAGIDSNGRKYSVLWLPVAAYDSTTASWTYWGDKSSKQKYIGWYYTVEWYDEVGKKVDTDTIRINLTNKDCHNNVEPFYMGTINVNKLVQDSDEVLILNGGDLE